MVAMATNLEGQLGEGLKTALKAKDTRTANLIRMIKTKIMERRTADTKGAAQPVVDDALVLDVIATYKKSMEKAKAEYAAAGDRGKEQLEELEFEIGWCKQWLPRRCPRPTCAPPWPRRSPSYPRRTPRWRAA